jgi:hypothetical protein
MNEGSNLFDNVRATVTDLKLTKEPPDNYKAEGNPIFANLSLLINGTGPEEDRKVSQSYSLGAKAGDNFEISEDGYSLLPTNDDATLRKDSKFGTLIASLKNEGVPANVLQSGTLKSLIGIDGQWKRVADKERTFAQENSRKASKFPPSTLVCVKLHVPFGQKATSAPSDGVAPAASTGSDGDLKDITAGFLLDVLGANPKGIQRAKLSLALTKAAMAHPKRTEIAKMGADESFLKGLSDDGLVKYNPAEKPQTVYAA